MILEELVDAMNPAESGVSGVELELGVGARVTGAEVEGDLTVLTIQSEAPFTRLALRVALGRAEGYWFPTMRHRRTLLPDWAGSEHASLIDSAPIGSLYDREGRGLLSFALDRMVEESDLQFGVSEEERAYVVYISFPTGSRVVRLAIARPGRGFADSVGELSEWMARAASEPLSIPESARAPLYCTWYAFAQDIDAESVEREALLAAGLGCGAIIIDDGWQELGDGRWYRGVGDWQPDTAKFPAFAEHVSRLRSFGLDVVLWVAPLLLGAESRAHPLLERYAPFDSPALRARVLDPRFAEVREHIVSTCVRLIKDFGLSGLKIDFLDQASVYQGTPTNGDIPDVGVALETAFVEMHRRLRDAGIGDVLIEFRQKYVGPATAPFANLLRADDCPADAVVNRISTIDLRMHARHQLVHSDPVIWDPRGGVEIVGRQLLNAFFAVPQLSARLSQLDDEHLAVVRFGLERWISVRDVVLGGRLDPGLASEYYPIVRATLGDRSVIGAFQSREVSIDTQGARHITLLNATSNSSVLARWQGGGGCFRVRAWSPTGVLVDEYDVDTADRFTDLRIPTSGVAELAKM